MGEVYRARDTRLGREVAIKVMPAAVASDPDRVRRFELEARAASTLNHPNILTVHDVGVEDGVAYLVTELLRGESLRDLITRGPLSADRARTIAMQVSRGLAAAHHAGIVHRDLKPENLFVTPDGVCKILDFGLARVERPELSAAGTASPTAVATTAGTLLGTVGYMAPEQVRGQAADARSDIFSLGVVMHEMLSGQSPFLRESVVESLNAILKEEPSAPVPSPLLASMIGRCLEKDPARRFQSASDLAFALEHVSDAGGAAVVTSPRRKWRRWWIAVPVAIALAALLWMRMGGEQPAQVAATPVRSLVVVPFTSLSHESSDEYFSAGMTDALTTELSRIAALKVIASHSASRFQDSTRSRADIAKELGVEALVTGSVLRDGDRVRISAQLAEAATDRVLWAENYERSVSDVLALQGEVTRAIANAIALELSPAEEARLGASAPVDPRALDEYLKGRYLWSQRTEPSVRAALEHFQKSAAIAPDFALAHTGIADAYLILAAYNYEEPLRVTPLALEALTRAMELDSTAGEPHATRGDFAFHVERNYALALREADRAVELSPGYATAHIWRGEALAVVGRLDEAIGEMQRAIALDPLTPFPRFFLARAREMKGDSAGAERDYQTACRLMPGYSGAAWYARMLLRMGRADDALRVAGETAGSEANVANIATLGVVQALTGRREEALASAARMRTLAEERWTSPLDFAAMEAALGNREAALRHLRAAIEARDFRAPMLAVHLEIEFDALKDDPEFQKLIASVRVKP